jgi:hypothetical protein
MSQVPNRYFNNQVIQDVGRNLSLAIAGDPEREAARLDMKMREAQMKRQADQDALAAEDRAKRERGIATLSRVFEFGDEEVEAKHAIAKQALPDLGLDPMLFNILGTANPLHDAKAELQRDRLTAQSESLGKRLDRMELIEGIRSGDRRHGADSRLAGTMYTADMMLDRERMKGQTALALKKLTGVGGTPLDVSPEDEEDARNAILTFADNLGGTLEPAMVDKIVSDWAPRYQATRDSPNSMRLAIEKNLPNVRVVDQKRKLFGFGAPIPGTGKVTPGPAPALSDPVTRPGAAAAPALPGGGNLSGAFGGPAMAPGAGVMLPTSAAPPARAPITVNVTGAPEVRTLKAAGKLQAGDTIVLPNGEQRVVE